MKRLTIEEELELIDSVCGKCKHYNDEDDTVCLSCKKIDQKRAALSHKELVNLGARWISGLISRTGGWHILTETGYRKENPDVFAFTKYYSILIECKASRADFLKDKKKPFRQDPQLGVGRRRFYLVNKGVAKPSEMPKGWQLLIAYDEDCILLPEDFKDPVGEGGDLDFHVRNATAEIELMYSWLYRKEHNCLPLIDNRNVATLRPEYWLQGDSVVDEMLAQARAYKII